MKRIVILTFLAIFLFGANSLIAQNWNWGSKTIQGEGKIVTQTLDLASFTSIGLSIPATVTIKKGSQQQVTIEAQQNIIDALEREVDNDGWDITFGDNLRVKNYKDITIHITIPTIKALAVASRGDIHVANSFAGLDKVKLAVAGSGDITFDGSASYAKISIAGSGDVNAENLKVEDCKVSIAGSGDCSIEVSGELKVSIAGSGDVRYKGSPKVSVSSVGSGTVRSVEY